MMEETVLLSEEEEVPLSSPLSLSLSTEEKVPFVAPWQPYQAYGRILFRFHRLSCQEVERAIQETHHHTIQDARAFQGAYLDTWRMNSFAIFDFWSAFLSNKDPSRIFSLQTEYAKRQADVFQEQWRCYVFATTHFLKRQAESFRHAPLASMFTSKKA